MSLVTVSRVQFLEFYHQSDVLPLALVEWMSTWGTYSSDRRLDTMQSTSFQDIIRFERNHGPNALICLLYFFVVVVEDIRFHDMNNPYGHHWSLTVSVFVPKVGKLVLKPRFSTPVERSSVPLFQVFHISVQCTSLNSYIVLLSTKLSLSSF